MLFTQSGILVSAVFECAMGLCIFLRLFCIWGLLGVSGV